MDTEIERKIRSEHGRFLQEKGRARDIQNDRVLSAYRQAVIDGEDAECVPVLAKRFSLSERQVQNIIDKRGKNKNPKFDVMMEGKMVRHLEGLDSMIHMAVDEMRCQLLDLERAQADGEEYFTVELMEVSGDKIEHREKRVPIGKAKLALMDEIMNAHIKFPAAMNKLLGNQTVNIFQDNRAFTGSFAELQDQLRSVRAMEELRGVNTVLEGEHDD